MSQGLTTVQMPTNVTGPDAPANQFKPGATVDQSQSQTLILGKFKSSDDLAKAYTELEKKLGSNKSPPTATVDPTKSAETPSPDQAKPGLAVADPPVQETPNVLKEFSDEYTKTGKLSDDSYKKLADRGLTRDFVDTYINGYKAQSEKAENKVYEAVGGIDQYTKIGQWAAANLNPAEKEAYNNAVKGSVEQASFAAQGLKARFEAANGRDPNLVGGSKGTSGPAGYADKYEMQKDMGSPRYQKDASFRKEVQDRVSVTAWL